MKEDTVSRVNRFVHDWNIEVEATQETATSILAFGACEGAPVVLKVLRERGDEWRSGEIVGAFEGRGLVRVRKLADVAALFERAWPGTPLVDLVLSGRDQEATTVLCEVIQQMGHVDPPPGCVTVKDWSHGFDRYLESSDSSIPKALVDRARDTYLQLCSTQRERRLLHGDLHHSNVLLDEKRGWLAIDPKGVSGELEYEIGASLRNPIDRPDLFCSREIVQRRMNRFEEVLRLDGDRALRWAFAQAVLSAIWNWEDRVTARDWEPVLALAKEIQSML
jgi:streptomycin 6-kinase